MVGRHNSFSVTKRSLRNAETTAGKRPRRIVQSKLVDDTVGLSRQEEQELNKALYASLQENRRSKSLPGNVGHESSSSSTSNGGPHCSSKSSSVTSSSRSLRRSLKSNKRSLGHRHSLRTGPISNKYHLRQSALLASRAQRTKTSSLITSVPQSRASTSSTSTANINLDESSQDSVRSSTSSANGSKRKIHAQRKFAQGCSLPGTPSCTPVKSATPPTKMMSFRIPKTEDFLTFLCLRGTSVLPPHLDFFNYSREEMASRDEAAQRSGPATAGKGKQQRESTPDDSSTSSGANEEAAQVATPSPSSRGGNSFLARRSAARASAGTPETARGIVSLRQGLHRKVSTSSSSSSLACFPVSYPSPTLTISRLTNCTTAPVYRNKFYFTPEKPLSPSKASGIRPGEFTPPPLFSSTRSEASHLSKPYTFSPLVRSSSSSKLSSLHSCSDSSASRGSYSSLSSSASMQMSPEALLRKLEAPDLSSKDNRLKVKVTPLCTSASLSSFRVGHCHRLEPQESLPPSTPSTKCTSPSLLSKSSSSSFATAPSYSSPSLVCAFSGRSTEVNKIHSSVSLPESPMGSPEFEKHPQLTPPLPILTNKHDSSSNKSCPKGRYGKKHGFTCQSAKAVKHCSSDFEGFKQRINLLASRCCFHSNYPNTNPSNTKLNNNSTNNSYHCLNQSSCPLHDCSCPESCAVLPCACSHNRLSHLPVCSCSPPKCACKMPSREGPSMHQFHHHTCFAPCSTHHTSQAFRCVDISQDVVCGGHPKGCECYPGVHSQACDAGEECAPSTCDLVLGAKDSTVQDESAWCCHDIEVTAKGHPQDATKIKTYNSIDNRLSSVIDNNLDRAHVSFKDRLQKALKVGSSKQARYYSLDPDFETNCANSHGDLNTESNASNEPVTCNLKGSNFHNDMLSATKLHPCYEIEENLPDGLMGVDKRWLSRNKYRKQNTQNKDKNAFVRSGFELQDKLPAFSHKTVKDGAKVSSYQFIGQSQVSTAGLARSSESFTARQRWVRDLVKFRKHYGCDDFVRYKSRSSALAKLSKHDYLVQSNKVSKKTCKTQDFQQEFVKMLDGKGFDSKSKTHQPQCSSGSKMVTTDSVPISYDSDWSVFDQRIPEMTPSKDRATFCGQSKKKYSLKATTKRPDFIDSGRTCPARPDLLTAVGEFPASFNLGKQLSLQKMNTPDASKHSSVNLESPSNDILILRDQVISAFEKFNRKDVIASSIQAAKAVEFSNIDPFSVVGQVMSCDKVTLACETQVTPGNQRDILQNPEDCTVFNIVSQLPAEKSLEQADDPFAAKAQSQGLKDINSANDKQETDDESVVDKFDDDLTESKQGSKVEIISDLKKTRHNSVHASFNQDKLLFDNLEKGGVISCIPEVALAHLGWAGLNKGMTERRNKQIQTNLCAAVGHCSISHNPVCPETFSFGTPKPDPGSGSPAIDVSDYYLCQNKLKKHSAELQECLCAACKVKFCSQQLYSSKDCIDKKDSFDDTVSKKLTLTSDKLGLFQGCQSFQPMIKPDSQVPVKVLKSEIDSSCSQADMISAPTVSLVERVGLLPSVNKELNIKNQVEDFHVNICPEYVSCATATSSKITRPQSSKSASKLDFMATKSTIICSVDKERKCFENYQPVDNHRRDHITLREDAVGSEEMSVESKDLENTSVIRSKGNEALSKKLSAEESHIDFAIDLSVKRRSSPVSPVDCFGRSNQITAANQLNVTSAATSKNLVPFDLTEIFEWSIPNNASKPKLGRANVEGAHAPYCDSSGASINVRPDLPAQRISVVDRIKAGPKHDLNSDTISKKYLHETKNGSAPIGSHQIQQIENRAHIFNSDYLDKDSQSDQGCNQFSRNNNVMLSSCAKSVKPTSLVTRDLQEKARNNHGNSKNCHLESIGDVKSKIDRLISNASRKKEHVSTDALEKPQNRQFTNEDLSRLIESVASTGKLTKSKRNSLDSKKEGCTRGNRPLVKSKSLDDSGTCVGSDPLSRYKPPSKAPILLHSYGSLNTGQGFALVNGQLRQCQILNKRQLLGDSTPKNDHFLPGSVNLPNSGLITVHATESTDVYIQPKVIVSQELTSKTYTDYTDASSGLSKNLPLTVTSCNVSDIGVQSIFSSTPGSSKMKTKSLSFTNCASQKIHCLGKSIYLHHNTSDLVECRQNDDQQIKQRHCVLPLSFQQNDSNQLCGLNLSVISSFPCINGHFTGMDDSETALIEFENRKSSVEKGRAEDVATSQSENIDDIVIIEIESKSYPEIDSAKCLQSDVSGLLCKSFAHSTSQGTASCPSPCSSDVFCTSYDVKLLPDEPINLHVPSNVPLVEHKEGLNSAHSLKHIQGNNSERVSNDSSTSSAVLNGRGDQTQDISDSSQKTFTAIQCYPGRKLTQKSNAVVANKFNKNSESISNQSTNESVNVVGHARDSSNILAMETLHWPASSEEDSIGYCIDTDLPHVSLLESDLCLPDPFSLIHSLKNVQASNENILEALMEELQVQISILKEEINQGNKDCPGNAQSPGSSLHLLHEQVNFEQPVNYRAPGQPALDCALPQIASQLPLDLSETVNRGRENPIFQSAHGPCQVDYLEISSDTDD